MNNLISLKKISKNYILNNKVKALRNINLDFELGKIYSIVGPSGSGKSTLLNILSLIDKPSSISINSSISTKLYLSLLDKILPIVDFPTPIIPVKVRFFATLASFLVLIFHKYVLFIEFKLILKVCNLNTIENKALETLY